MSVVRHHKPRLIMIHTDRKHLRGKYWDQVAQLNSSQTVILLNRIKRPIYIFDVKLSSVYHASDIVRIRTLRKYGGIYLDNDVYVIKPLHQFRRFELTLGWPENQFMGKNLEHSTPNSYLHLWFQEPRWSLHIETHVSLNSGTNPIATIGPRCGTSMRASCPPPAFWNDHPTWCIEWRPNSVCTTWLKCSTMISIPAGNKTTLLYICWPDIGLTWPPMESSISTNTTSMITIELSARWPG